MCSSFQIEINGLTNKQQTKEVLQQTELIIDYSYDDLQVFCGSIKKSYISTKAT